MKKTQNKARLFLTSLGVLATIGGALAFKANHKPFLPPNLYTISTLPNGSTICTTLPYCTTIEEGTVLYSIYTDRRCPLATTTFVTNCDF